MNKRAHIRHLVAMPARLILGGEPDRVCQVQDFCLGGMLLVLPEPGLPSSKNLEPDTSVRLALDVQGIRGMRRVVLPARVRRRNGMSVGVAFDQPDARDLLAVQHHVRTLLQKERCGAPDPAERRESSRPQPDTPGASGSPFPKATTYRTAWRLNRHAYTAAGACCAAGEVPEACRHTLARALKPIQSAGLGDRALPEVVDQLVREKGLGHGAELRAQAELVEALVRLLAENPLLDDTLRRATIALQLPVLRTVLVHEHVLADSHAVLVQLLDRMVMLGALGHATEALAAADALMNANPFNLSMLEDISNKLHESLRDPDARFRALIACLVPQYRMREQRSNAERSLNAQLETRLCGRPIPAVIVTLLNAGWRDLLIEAFQQGGAQGAQAENALALLDRLVLALDQVPPPEELSVLLARIRHGLARTERRVSGARLGSLLRDLLAPERRAQASPDVLRLPPGTFEKSSPASCRHASDEAGVREFIEKLSQGEWFVLQERGKRRALRFVWGSQNQELFVFAGPTGEHPEELDRVALAQAVLDGRLRHLPVLATSPVMDALQTALEQRYRDLSVAARHDPVTGLLTQSELKRRLSRESGARGTLIRIEPSGGSAASPEQKTGALRCTAGVLKEMFHNRLTGRAAGEGLLLWLSGTGLIAARTAVESMRRRVHALRQGKPMVLSFGLAERQPLQSLSSLIHEANAACRVAVARGGGVQLAEPRDEGPAEALGFHLPAEARIVLQSRHAVAEPDDLRPACIVEARLVGPGGQDLAPGSSSRAAIDPGHLPALDRRMITSLLRWLNKNRDVAARFDHFLLRLSRLALRDGGLPDFLHEQFERYSIDPGLVCLAFAEADVAEDLEAARRRMSALRKRGCRLALVGIGLAEITVSQLGTLPIQILGPDEALIEALRSPEPHSLALIHGLLDVARLVGCRTLVSHVPDAATGERLKKACVDWVEQCPETRPAAPARLSLNAAPTETSY